MSTRYNKEQLDAFSALAHSLVAWLNEHGRPHMSITITQSSVELTEGIIGFPVLQYIKD